MRDTHGKVAKSLCYLMMTGSLLLSLPVLAQVVDLKVLVISTGTPQEDLGLDLIDDMLDQLGVPYEVLDSSRELLSPAKLATGEHGHFNGIILTNAELYVSGIGSGLTLDEWRTLHEYERAFSVRESVMSGFPATNPSLDLNYGMTNISAGSSFTAVWLPPAGGSELFEYVNTANTFSVTDYAIAADPLYPAGGALPLPGSGAPVVQPLLVDQETGKALVSKLTYEDGREVLLSTITNAWYLEHSQVLNYEFFNFATKGVFLGARRVYFSAHLDDLFLADDIWNPDTKQSDATPYRNIGSDIENALTLQQAFIKAHPTVKNFKLAFAFNGSGAGIPVTRARDDFSVKSYANNDGDLDWVTPWIEEDPRGQGPNGGLVAIEGGKLVIRSRSGAEPAVMRVVNLIPPENSSGTSTASLTLKFSVSKAKPGDVAVLEISMDGDHWVPVEEFPGNFPWTTKNYDITPYAAEESWIRFRVFNRSTGTFRGRFEVDYLAIRKEVEDSLTRAIMAHKSQFRFINHTFTHERMDGSSGFSYEKLKYEVVKNRQIWQQLGLPEYAENLPVIVTGEHSGLEDRKLSIPYPDGMNVLLMQAMEDSGFQYLASDSSRVNQNVESYVPGFPMMILPRYPANLFYNVTTPENWTDEYNYVFHDRYIENGQDPCVIPGAICQTRTFPEILRAEAKTAFRHLLSYRLWPHYFHVSNLCEYSPGRSLMFDWLESTLSYYEQWMTLPIVNLPYYQIGEISKKRLSARAANVKAFWDLDTDTVTLTADTPVSVEITGIQGGESYGGQRLGEVNVGPTPVTVTVDRANK